MPRRLRGVSSLLFAAGIAGCNVVGSVAEPWKDPVDDSVAVTRWFDDGQPAAPFGPGGASFESPEQLVESMVRSMARAGGEGTIVNGAIAGRTVSGTVVGWVRIEGTDPGTVAALDLRLDMRNDGGGTWFVARVESREHCREELRAGECPPDG